jgi:hypothetical protein
MTRAMGNEGPLFPVRSNTYFILSFDEMVSGCLLFGWRCWLRTYMGESPLLQYTKFLTDKENSRFNALRTRIS